MPSRDIADDGLDAGETDCPGAASLESALVPGSEPDVGLASHLEGCERCRNRLELLAGGHELLDAMSAPAGETRLVEGFENEPELRRIIDSGRNGTPEEAERASLSPELWFLRPPEAPGYVGRLGPYNVIGLVGQGGMGVVFKAHDPSLDRIVAIKVLAPALAANPTARRRFVREARAAAAVTHEHVVTIHAVDEADGLPYLVMQFVGGPSLEARVRAAGALKVEEVLRIGMQAASGLAAAHAQGLVHRDVKPANIMLENGAERVKITDFGLARAADDAAVTLTGQVAGTPMYMAPEQARGERVDHRADLFSLGAVLYTMCTGRPPFAAANPLTSLRKVCDEEPPPVERLNEAIPPRLGDVVRRLMSKDPAARPESATAVANELARQLANLRNSAHTLNVVAPDVRAPSKRSRGAWALGSVALAVLALSPLVGSDRIRSWLGGGKTDPARFSSASGPASTPTPAGSGPFWVSSLNGQSWRGFASLADAIVAAAPGDVVELRADGRIVTPRIDIGTKPLLLRAGKDRSPVLVQSQVNQSVLTTRAPLVLEGIGFEGSADESPQAGPQGSEPGECLVVAAGSPVRVLNCRFIARSPLDARFGCLRVAGDGDCEIRNSEVYGFGGTGLQWLQESTGAAGLRLRNCTAAGRAPLVVRNKGSQAVSVDADGCAFMALWFLTLLPEARHELLTMELTRCAVVARTLYHDVADPVGRPSHRPVVKWKDSRTVFDIGRGGGMDPGEASPGGNQGRPPSSRPGGGPRVDGVDSIDAEIRWRGVFRAILANQSSPVPGDFEIQSIVMADGRRATSRMLSLVGVRSELVGGGAAYEAFKRSSAYLQWQQQVEEVLRKSPR